MIDEGLQCAFLENMARVIDVLEEGARKEQPLEPKDSADMAVVLQNYIVP